MAPKAPMRLLFVDDEQRVLSGLRRRLHGRSPGWELSFAGGGAEALELLAAGPFDAVISDMRMPVVDGTRVLSQAARAWPRSLRIVLSGHAEGRAAVRLGSCAHRFLDKPCSTDVLTSEIAKGLELRAALDADAAARVAGEAAPSHPGDAAGARAGDDPAALPLDALWNGVPGLVEGMPEVLATLGGEGGPAEEVALTALADDDGFRRVLGVAAAVRSDLLGLDASPQAVVEAFGPPSVLAVVAAGAVQHAAGGDAAERLSRGTSLAVSAYAAGRARELSPDELADVVLAALLHPLARAVRWDHLSWLLSAWGVTPRAAAALAPGGSRGAVGQALAVVLDPLASPQGGTQGGTPDGTPDGAPNPTSFGAQNDPRHGARDDARAWPLDGPQDPPAPPFGVPGAPGGLSLDLPAARPSPEEGLK